jgi:hypothetical protein
LGNFLGIKDVGRFFEGKFLQVVEKGLPDVEYKPLSIILLTFPISPGGKKATFLECK